MTQQPHGSAWSEPEAGGIDAGRPGDLGSLLKGARITRGMELADIAELTHVRREYLKALEESRFGDLPEDVYTRNFVRLYAQAVGISPDNAMAAYIMERRRAGGLSTLEQRLEKERRGEPPPAPKRRSGSRGLALPRLGPALPTLLLVAALVGLAVWGFNQLLFNPDRSSLSATGSPTGQAPASTPAATQTTPQTTENPPPVTLDPPAIGGAAVDDGPRTILISITSDPPGATVSIDSFALPGATPIRDAPVTARPGRILNLRLDGYEPHEQSVDLLESQSLHVDLSPAVLAGGQEAPAVGAAGQGQLHIAIRASTWLEVYRSTERNVGERLVYRTAEPGETFVFDLPVYVHVGNAAGVEVTVGDTPLGALGSSGAVVGRAFTAQ